MDRDWAKLVKDAGRTDEGFKKLLCELEPALFIIAGRLSNSRLLQMEELVQLARIKIWRSLRRVKLDRPDTIKGLLITVGVNAMRDNIRLESAKHAVSLDQLGQQLTCATVKSMGLFQGLLLEYENYIRETGGFRGAHKYFAKKYDTSLWTARRGFHIAVAKYLEELNE